MMDLLSAGVGGRVVEFNDEFFAPAVNLIDEQPPVWREGEYTDRGKWMDGWETRRRREPGHDWCVLALGIPGQIRRVTVDTSHFTGNYAERFSLEACGVAADDRLGRAEWVEVIPETGLTGDSVASFEVADHHRVTYVRLNIFPDGGIARLRIDGEPIPSREEVCPSGAADLVSLVVGGEALAASDTHYSHPSNLLRPTPSRGMWDGWETKRRRGPGHDWATFRLGLPGTIESVEVDTTHFKGNSPGWVSLEVSDDAEEWSKVAEMVPVTANVSNHVAFPSRRHASYLRLSIHPDGGVARLRVIGRPDLTAAGEMRLRYLNSLYQQEATGFFRTACASGRWVEEMSAARPFTQLDEMFESAQAAFDRLTGQDWMEAFQGHPRIGERGDAIANKEQSAAADASRGTVRELARVNSDYEAKFGFTFIVYASGKSADEMLGIARERLANSREDEIVAAASEQRRITDTRLRRMTCQERR